MEFSFYAGLYFCGLSANLQLFVPLKTSSRLNGVVVGQCDAPGIYEPFYNVLNRSSKLEF